MTTVYDRLYRAGTWRLAAFVAAGLAGPGAVVLALVSTDFWLSLLPFAMWIGLIQASSP